MVNLTIDGKKVEVEAGTTVLNAARKAGIEIPTLCDHPQLIPYGGCRLCLVEIEGAMTLQPSCTMPVSNGMVVKTDTEKCREARKFILTMIFSERNHFCPYCQVSGGDCELQNSAYAEGMTHWPIQPNWKPYPVDASHPFIILEHNRCILCRRCVKACGELVGNFTLSFEERGADSILVADLGVPLGESSCIGCGTCVQVCPTGTLIDRWSAYQGMETELDVTQTVCLGCSVGCAINVMTRDNRFVRIEGNWEGKINEGIICEVGRFHPMVEDRDRIRTPMIRKNGSLKAATWEDALEEIKKGVINRKTKIAGVASTRLSLEALNTFSLICKQLGVDKIASTEDSKISGSTTKLLDKVSEPYESQFNDIKESDCFFLLGEDITKDHQVISFFVKRRLPTGAKLIQVTESESGFDNFADYSFKIPANQTVELVHTFSKFMKEPGDVEQEKTAKQFNIDLNTLQGALATVKNAQNPAVILGTRCEKLDVYTLVEAGYDLAKSIHGKFLTTKGNINSLGGSHLKIHNPVDLNDVGIVLFALGDEEISQQLMKKFEKVPFMIVLGSYSSPLTVSANVVLPTAIWLEQNGHFLNIDGHILEARSALIPPEGVLSNEQALAKLADILRINISSDWEKMVSSAPSVVPITK